MFNDTNETDVFSKDARARILIDIRTDENRKAVLDRKKVEKLVYQPLGYRIKPIADETLRKQVHTEILQEPTNSLSRAKFLGEIADELVKVGAEKTFRWLVFEKLYNKGEASALIRETEEFVREQTRRDIMIDYAIQVRRLEDLIARCRDSGDKANEIRACTALARIQGLTARQVDPKDGKFSQIMKGVTLKERSFQPKELDIDEASIPERFKTPKTQQDDQD